MELAINNKEWVKTTWPFNIDYAKKASTVWAKKFAHGTVYLQETPNFDYVSDFGSNSDNSYSGCFYDMGVKDVEMAKQLLDYKIPEELSGTSHNLIKRHMSYMLGRQLTEINNQDLEYQQWRQQMSPTDIEHGKTLKATGFWGKQGAGAIILAKSTGRILLPYRSSRVEQPNTWGVWGGAIDQGEDPKEAVKRELHEEVGYDGLDIELIPLYIFSDEKSGFKYHNFLAIVADEFRPELNWETDNFKWVIFGEWPQPLHFGLKALIQHSGNNIQKIIEKNKDGQKLTESDGNPFIVNQNFYK